MGIYIFAIMLVALVAIFSVQNALPVSIAFLAWKFQASLAIVIFISALSGAAITSIMFVWRGIIRHGKEKKTEFPVSD